MVSDNDSSISPATVAIREEAQRLSGRVGEALLARQWHVATAESCTGGLIAAFLTDIAGSSSWFGFGWVSYANAAKRQMLGISPTTLLEHGAVSEPVVSQMAETALQSADADIAIAVSGIAGPGGATATKPVGTVWHAWATETGVTTHQAVYPGERDEVRLRTAVCALAGILERV